MMRVTAANLAVIVLNMTLVLIMYACMAMQIPAPPMPAFVFVGADLIISGMVWVIVFFLTFGK